MEQNKKKFLYLIQSRIKFLQNHEVLESDDSDVIVLSFEKKIEKENFIYLPDSTWDEGRNALIKHAMAMPYEYQYYVFLDDDIQFVSGNFRDFEKEVLAINPDFSAPVYSSRNYVHWYHKFFARFKYSGFVLFDSAFICLSKELFHDKRIIPYHTEYNCDPNFRRSHYPSRLFWMNLYEYFHDRKLLVINSIVIKNTNHDGQYNEHYIYAELKKRVQLKNPNYKNTIEKEMPLLRRADKDFARNLPRRIRKKLIKMDHALDVFIAFLFVFPIRFVNDIRLNRALQKEEKNRSKKSRV